MKKILRLDFIATTLILCASFLVCGIVEINDRTSYVISGQQSEVFRSQKQDGSASFSLEKAENGSSEDPPFFSVSLADAGKVVSYAKYCAFPPLGCIISYVEEISKE